MFLLCFGCNEKRDYGEAFQRADSLSDTGMADSALVVIDSIRKSGVPGKREAMYLDLLTVKAKDRANDKPENDSIIKSLLHYYIDGNKERSLHSKVYFYAARAYAELKKYPQALENYTKSLESIPDDGKHNEIKSEIYGQIGSLYDICGLYSRAIHNFHKQIEYGTFLHDTASLVKAHMQLASAYARLGERDSVMIEYDLIEPLVKEYGDSILKSLYYKQKIAFHVSRKEFGMADSLYQVFPINLNEVRDITMLNSFINLFMWRRDYDVLKRLSPEILSNENPNIRRQIIGCLCRIHVKEGDIAGGVRYANEYMALTDSMNTYPNDSDLSISEALYEFKDKEDQIHQLHQKNRINAYIVVACMLGTLVLACGFLLLIYLHRLNMKPMKDLQLRLEIRNNELKMEQSILMAHQQEELARIKTELREKGEALMDWMKKYNELKASSSKALERRERHLKEIETQIATVKQELKKKEEKQIALNAALDLTMVISRLLDGLTDSPDNNVNQSLYELSSALSAVSPQFIKALKGMGLKSRDEWDAMLIWVNIPLKTCGKLLGVSPQALSNSRRRLFDKYASESGAANWMEYIRSIGGAARRIL